MLVKWDPLFDAVCGADITNLESEPKEDSGVRDWLHGRADAVGREPSGRRSEWRAAASAYGIGATMTKNETH